VCAKRCRSSAGDEEVQKKLKLYFCDVRSWFHGLAVSVVGLCVYSCQQGSAAAWSPGEHRGEIK
jgi:hypothetical protein